MISFSLQGCVVDNGIQPIVTDPKAAEGQYQTHPAAPTVWRGIYTSGAEVSEFAPCNSAGQYYWLSLAQTDVGFDRLKSRVNELRLTRGEPYPAVYIEFVGEAVGKASDGFAADYDEVIQLRRLVGFDDTLPAECPASEDNSEQQALER
ncbi:hypothetical protein L2725_02660 [Shewanella corallii]|uniref:Lipoprotein n=1 Tax=Shewanella corallii TaxID=560080 RepID=A0ABT0N494_9GAMM|nr:hypothetical protein [Shewanella corallii]MCL2912691.1 hypothetical protein [Shewanella corallii]